MTFDEQYPEHTIPNRHGTWYDPLERPDIFRQYRQPNPCAICKTPTYWIELNYEASFCSDDCLRRMDAEYTEACRDE